MGGILQATISIFGIIGGPLLGLFTLGILCPLANSKGALSGLVSGLVFALWVGIGAQIYPPLPDMSRPLPLSTDTCNFTMAHGFNWTSSSLLIQNSTAVAPVHKDDNRPVLADLYSLSYLYFSPLGTIVAMGVGLIVSILTGGCKLKVEPRLMLKKEDTTFYYFIKMFKGRIKSRSGHLDLKKDREMTFGNANPAFTDFELDLAKSSVS